METPDLAGSIELLAERDAPFALATIVAVRGSAYRRPGARAVLPEGGDPIGSLSPGCLEMELLDVARAVRESGRPELREFDLTGDDEAELGWGLGCQGVVSVFLEPPAMARELAAAMRSVASERRPRAIVTVLSGDLAGSRAVFDGTGVVLRQVGSSLDTSAADAARSALVDGRSTAAELEPDGVPAFVEVLRPPIRLAIFGDRSDAPALADAGRAFGWDVVSFGRRGDLDRELLDERTFAVIMNHSYATDGEQLRALLETPVPYIGVLGPRSRTERLLHEIEGADGIERVFAPAGLDVGAEGPQEIASAIVSEIIAVDRGRSGGSLRDRTASIHADRPANIRS